MDPAAPAAKTIVVTVKPLDRSGPSLVKYGPGKLTAQGVRTHSNQYIVFLRKEGIGSHPRKTAWPGCRAGPAGARVVARFAWDAPLTTRFDLVPHTSFLTPRACPCTPTPPPAAGVPLRSL